jgi:hypothetical protein
MNVRHENILPRLNKVRRTPAADKAGLRTHEIPMRFIAVSDLLYDRDRVPADQNSTASGARCNIASLESDRQGGYHTKVWDVAGDAELCRDIEEGSIPEQRAEPHVDAAQNSVRVWLIRLEHMTA